jgi:hypothetical protein
MKRASADGKKQMCNEDTIAQLTPRDPRKEKF